MNDPIPWENRESVLEREVQEYSRERSKFIDAIEEAWGVIANVNYGDWHEQSEAWQKAAMDWRSKYIGLLGKLLQERAKLRGDK